MTSTAPASPVVSPLQHATITPRYVGVLAILSGALAFEMFDFIIVSFLLSAIAPLWKLTFGQSAIVLLAAGLGAILGAGVTGPLADRYGRRPFFLLGLVICPLAAAGTGLIADGDWVTFAVLRLILGVGYGMAGVAQFTMIVELTPMRYRTMLASATMIPVSIGFIMAPAAMALFYDALGWRGLAFVGVTPVFFAALVYLFIPESPDWLVSRGRLNDADRAARKLMGGNFEPARPTALVAPAAQRPTGRLRDHPRLMLFVILAYGLNATGVAGVLMWGPMFLAILLDLPPQAAAGYFFLIGVVGLIGRVIFTFLAPRIGRRRIGQIHGFGAGLCLAVGTLYPEVAIFGTPLFVVMLMASAFFFDGGQANLQPHAAEVFPVEVSARGMGASQVALSTGKIVGPLILALLAGTGNVVMPQATRDALVPGFLTMAALFILFGLTFTFLGLRHPRATAPTVRTA